MAKKLMLVESPHKAKVIKGFLGSDYHVLPTVGAMFDTDNARTEAQKKKYDTFGISTTTWERNLKCTNTKQFGEIKKQVTSGSYDTLVIATDPDRAGEQIGWEVVDKLSGDIKKKGIKVVRATWQEITKKAVEEGLANAGSLNMNAVDSAVARSIYDRLFGFTISGVLQKTVARGASGGRVQSPALRMVVNLEKERLAFVKAEYMSVTGAFAVGSDLLAAKLISVGGKTIATGNSFDSKGQLKKEDLVLTPDRWVRLEPFLKKWPYEISDVSTKPYTRKPPPPYTTSSFQQDVGTRLRLSSKQIMSVAQRLYEQSYISYMRSDSISLSQEATMAARKEAVGLYGKGAVPAQPRFYKTKSKNAQEGHEAIRPTTNDKGFFQKPSAIAAKLNAIDKNALAVYTCIYNRTVASQMNDAKGVTTTVTISSKGSEAKETAVFSTSATVFHELGWTALTKPVTDGDDEENNSLDAVVAVGDAATLKKVAAKEHTTTPPNRLTEVSAVAKLEAEGIGRPSTYASIVTVNQTRGYMKKKGQALYPTWMGMKVAQYLEANIPAFVAYEATALMEEHLDDIEQGSLKKSSFLSQEWSKVQQDVEPLGKDIDWEAVNSTSVIDLYNGYQVRVNKFGAWLEDSSTPVDEKGNRPGVKLGDDDDLGNFDFSDPEVCKKFLEAAANRGEDRDLGTLSSGTYSGWVVTARDGRFGPFLQATNPEDEKAKPINHKLPEGAELATVALKDVESLFAEVKLPRWSDDGKWLTGIGKKGAYMGRKATPKAKKVEFKSLPEGADPRTISFDEVKKLWEEA